MAIFAAILLLVASVTATLGAEAAFSSTLYNADSKVRYAHQYLTIAAALGWSALVVLIVILIVAAIAGGFTSVEVSEALLSKGNPTRNDLVAAYQGEKELSAGQTTQVIVLIILVIIALVTLIVGILAAVAAVQLSDLTQQDNESKSAYNNAIIAAISGIGGIGVMIVAIIAYISIRAAREKQLADLEAFEKRAELQLGVTPTQIIPVTPTITPTMTPNITPTQIIPVSNPVSNPV